MIRASRLRGARMCGARGLASDAFGSTVAPSPPPVDIVQRAEMPDGVPSGYGGRHGRSGKTVAVFGATGFLGGYIVSELGLKGHNIVVATRGDDMSWRHLKPCADYGKLVPSYISMKDEASVRETIKGADIVVNCMGKYYETKHYFPTLINCSYEDVHIDAAETVARVAREEDVKHLVHVSCAYANADSESRWARTKAEGDKRVVEQFPGAVLVRPNILYGQEDRFLNTIAIMGEKFSYVPLVNGGASKISPVYVGDVGTAIAEIASNYFTAGESYNLSGNQEYTWKQVYEFIMDLIHFNTPIVDMPLNQAVLAAKAINNLPNPWFAPEEIIAWQEDAKRPAASDKTFADLSMNPIGFEGKAHKFLYRFQPGGHFVDARSNRTEHA